MKPKKCKQCSKEFTPYRPLQYVCSPKCAVRYTKAKERAKKKRQKDEVKKYSKLFAEARASFQKWIRHRDKDQPCISCGKIMAVGEITNGSHYFKAEIFRGVVFNEVNVNSSCVACNKWLDGNLIGYRKGLINRYGLKKVEQLENEADRTRQRKWSRAELVEIRDRYKMKSKQ